jgi:hypothetical protein
MRFGSRLWIAALAAAVILTGSPAPATAQGAAEAPTLTPFASDRALRNFLRAVVAEERRENMAEYGQPFPPPPPPPPPPPSPPPPPPGAAAAPAAPAALSITNNQVIGVDEGDIVKARGDILVVLRRGRLFTVSLAGGAIRPVAAIDAFPPGVNAQGDWYDEMLISGDRVVVIGYSYRRTGTQVNRFRLGADGSLAFEDGYQLRSNDYYSSRNYASRLIGNRLILYSPLDLDDEGDVLDSLPALRQWQPNAAGGGSWRRTVGANNVYVPSVLADVRRADISTLHTVTGCDLAAAVLDCESTVVLGGYARTFFVSGNAIYLWIGNAWKEHGGSTAFVYRIPFDGARPSALQARGMPVDQFSFYPDAARSALHVVVRAQGSGDAMWSPEVTSGDVALLTIPMATFGSGAREVARGAYHPLPKPEGSTWSFQNRFVGDHLLYGTASTDITGAVSIVSLADYRVTRLVLPHGVDRLDAIGADAIAIGSGRGALGFSAIDLAGTPRIADTFLLPNAREGETRSHAFFFRPDPDSRDGSGLLGLPVARFLDRRGQPQGNSAGILFLNRRGGKLSEAGALNGSTVAGSNADDGCQASCADWYGNARPIFIGDRIFALLGYELVEGAARGGRVSEVGRSSFTPSRNDK